MIVEPDVARLLRRCAAEYADGVSSALLVPDVECNRILRTDWGVEARSTADWRVTVADASCGFGPLPQSVGPKPLLFMPKGKELLHGYAAAIAAQSSEAAELWVVGTRESGIQSAARPLQPLWEPLGTVVYASHARIEAFRRTAHPVAATEAFASRQASLMHAGRTITVAASVAPGVFAHDGLDDGTRLLLESLDDVRMRRVLDVGCGAGWIGAFVLATHGEARVDAVDVSWFALESARRTLAGHGERARVFASDGLAAVTDRYELIVSNPPFHQGHRQTLGPTLSWIAAMPGRLAPAGEVRIVANRFLPYADALAAAFGRVEVLREDARFRVWRARAASRGG
jgi:16S rRNA (guanine1207-N2)-methyltransferase